MVPSMGWNRCQPLPPTGSVTFRIINQQSVPNVLFDLHTTMRLPGMMVAVLYCGPDQGRSELEPRWRSLGTAQTL
jgi:hypothetical protein